MPVITMHVIELSRVIDKAIYCLNIFVVSHIPHERRHYIPVFRCVTHSV